MTQHILSIDLTKEVQHLQEQGIDFETDSLAPPDGAHGTEWVDILYIPSLARAGVAWGSDAVWFDATSVQDAYNQFFSID